jgi:hypothetical protein
MGNKTGEKGDLPLIKGVGQPVELPGMETRIGKKDFENIFCGRIAAVNNFDIIMNSGKNRHGNTPLSLKCHSNAPLIPGPGTAAVQARGD